MTGYKTDPDLQTAEKKDYPIQNEHISKAANPQLLLNVQLLEQHGLPSRLYLF